MFKICFQIIVQKIKRVFYNILNLTSVKETIDCRKIKKLIYVSYNYECQSQNKKKQKIKRQKVLYKNNKLLNNLKHYKYRNYSKI